jgi:hypothetical protein
MRIALFAVISALTACQLPPAPEATAPAEQTETTEATQAVEPEKTKVTLAQYEALATGMTLEEVVEQIGEGTELSRVEIEGAPPTVVYQWEGEGFGANMNATFQDGKLIGKAQFGLK